MAPRIVRAVLQRVSHASVSVDGEACGAIGPGYLILICAMQGDTEAQADRLAAKIVKLRVFRKRNESHDSKLPIIYKNPDGLAIEPH